MTNYGSNDLVLDFGGHERAVQAQSKGCVRSRRAQYSIMMELWPGLLALVVLNLAEVMLRKGKILFARPN